MGVQIIISEEEMRKAGFAHKTEQEVEYELNASGTGYDEFVTTAHYYEKDGVRLASYSPDYFMADCNAWGENRAYFVSLGLLDLPHKFV